MCGRYYVATEEELAEMREIIEEVAWNLGKAPAEAEIKTGEIFPTDRAPMFAPPLVDASRRADGRQRGGELFGHAGWQWRLAKWGFPHWQAKRPIINARAESAAEKPMFRRALQASRCAVPAAGFYEWRHVGGKSTKERYLFKQVDGRMLYMAGLAGVFRGEGSGGGNDASSVEGSGAVAYEAFTILTTAANGSVADIHNRMPVILAMEELGLWARDMAFVEEALRRPGPGLVRIAA